MGLFGALFAGVSGLDSQSNKIGIISNNISNVNTVGFKEGQAAFDTLVVPSGTTTFSPGGVIGSNEQLVNQQGLVQATSSPTDIAITGNGFFAVNSAADDTGSLLLTRSGSFTQDASGNFVNANGYFLQGIPITTPPTSVNLNNLKTVSVNQNATGSANATKNVTIGANLDATQSVLLGAPVNGTMNQNFGTSAINSGATGNQILIGTDYGVTSNLVKNSSFTITSGSNTPVTFTYGGYGVSRSVVTSGAAGNGDGANTLDTETVAAGAIANTNGQASIQVTVANFADYAMGGHISISGITAAIGGVPAAQINGEQTITNITGNVITFAVATTGTGGTSATTASVSNRTSAAFTGNILNATTVNGDFITSGTSGLTSANFTQTALEFSISVSGSTNNTFNFSYSNAPSPTAGTFNSLQSLVNAINAQTGLTATIDQTNGRLYVSSANANDKVTFANGDATGNGSSPGIDWVQELGLATINTTPPAAGTNYFNSLNGLANEMNTVDPSDLLATVNNPTATASLTINEANPLQSITVTDGQSTNSILKELGIANTVTNGSGEQSISFARVYNPTDPTKDMSSGAVTPQFSHDITIYDSLGTSHTIAMNVVKIATNQWAVEFTAVPKTDIAANIGTGDGQIASGILTFNGNGQLTGDTVGSQIPVTWANLATPSTLNFNLGLGGEGAVTQSAAAFNVSDAAQDGSPVGQLSGVTIDANGFVIETFSNGQTKQVFQIPLASVSNPDGLEGVSGDAYNETLASGQINLNESGQGGTGTITPSSLEQSNVDLSTQLTNLIVAQQAYGANSKLLTVADQLLQEIDQVIQ